MATYLLLALGDDGRATVYMAPPAMVLSENELTTHPSDCQRCAKPVSPVRTGTDRGPYSVYEVAGYSIDVVRMPEGGEVAK